MSQYGECRGENNNTEWKNVKMLIERKEESNTLKRHEGRKRGIELNLSRFADFFIAPTICSELLQVSQSSS